MKNKNQNNANEKINIISNLDRKVFSSSLFLEFLKSENLKKILYVDLFSYNDMTLLNEFEDLEKKKIEFGAEYTINGNTYWKIEERLDKEGYLKLILNFTKREEKIFIDISDLDILNDETLKVLKNSCSKIYFFDTNSIEFISLQF